MPFHCSLLLRPRPGLHAAFAPVKAAMVIIIYYNSAVYIRIMYNSFVNPHYGCIIAKPVAIPAAAIVAVACVAITIINATVKTYTWPPVAGVESIAAAHVAPVGRRPVKTRIWRSNPFSGNPIVTVSIVISPITRLPDIAVRRWLG